jgi:hypothetical protein
METNVIKSYKNQLVDLAKETGWELKDACVDAGIADSTYYRWINSATSPRLKEATQVGNYMCRYSRS